MTTDRGFEFYLELKALPNDAARAMRIAEVEGTVVSGMNVVHGAKVRTIRAATIRELGEQGKLIVGRGAEGYTYGTLPKESK